MTTKALPPISAEDADSFLRDSLAALADYFAAHLPGARIKATLQRPEAKDHGGLVCDIVFSTPNNNRLLGQGVDYALLDDLVAQMLTSRLAGDVDSIPDDLYLLERRAARNGPASAHERAAALFGLYRLGLDEKVLSVSLSSFAAS